MARKTLATSFIRVKRTGIFGCKHKEINKRNDNVLNNTLHQTLCLLTSLTTYFSKFLIVFSFRTPYKSQINHFRTINKRFCLGNLLFYSSQSREWSPWRLERPGTCFCRTWTGRRAGNLSACWGSHKGYTNLMHHFFRVKIQMIFAYFVYLLHLVKKSTREA